MRKKASLVINPRMGQNLAKITDILAVLAAAGWKTELAIKEYGGHSMQLAQDFAAGPQNLVIAYGGDGTLNQVVNGVMASGKGRRSVVGVIPGGTANVWAGEIGIPRDPVLAALALVNSQPRKVDVGRVVVEGLTFPEAVAQSEDLKHHKKKLKAARENPTTRHHFLLMAGLGIDAAIMGNVSKPLKYRIGPLAVGLSAAKELSSQHVFPIEISTSGDEQALLWKGEALQVVIGNTRRYADVAEMTPDAYIDDGILDVCIITGGSPLTTMEQITSLLLRRKPDNLTAEYFHGAHLKIRVPVSVPMQLDGSAVDLKDYLSKAEYDTLQEAGPEAQTSITYCFDALPKALTVDIPVTYDDTLFEHESGHESTDAVDEHGTENKFENKVSVKSHHHRKAEDEETPYQQRTEEVEGKVKDAEADASAKEESLQDGNAQVAAHERELIEQLVESGRKVSVVGKIPDPARKETYIIAGGSTKESTGEVKPVAVVVNAATALFNRKGERLSLASLSEVHQGVLIVVEGKKSKRGVIQAERLVL